MHNLWHMFLITEKRDRLLSPTGICKLTAVRETHLNRASQACLVEFERKYCEDTRPSAQLEASQQQHSELCRQPQGAEITIHPILLGVGGTIYNAHTHDHFEKLGIDSQRSETLARKLHAHSVRFAHKLTSTRRVIARFTRIRPSVKNCDC
eukprot:1138714-Pelagomonas_calceolata.AAC.3